MVTFRAADGAVAECHVPFPPLPAAARPRPGTARAWCRQSRGRIARTRGPTARSGCCWSGWAATRPGSSPAPPRTWPRPRSGSRLVHGRSAAGGTSQQRFARRREKQASEALGAAADTAAAVFGPYSGRLDAVVLGGDRRAIAGLRDDPRLRPYFKLAVERFLTVPDPRLAVLRGTPRLFRAIRIRLTEPPPPGRTPGSAGGALTGG